MDEKDKRRRNLERFLKVPSGSLVRLLDDMPPSPSARGIEEKARCGVDEAIRYFTSEGVVVPFVPQVAYLDSAPESGLAAVRAARDAYKKFIQRFGRPLMKNVYNLFCLELSDDALDESMDVACHHDGGLEIMYPDVNLGTKADIFLFPGIRVASISENMAHEVWHLIERRRGFLHGKDLIIEGTARYAQNRFAGKASRWFKDTDYVGMVYDNAAHLVELAVKHHPRPLQAILDRPVRAKIREAFDREIMPFYYDALAGYIVGGGYYGELIHKFIAREPAYAAFGREPSDTNLLNAMRERGHNKLAEELATQDVSLLVNFMQRKTEVRDRVAIENLETLRYLARRFEDKRKVSAEVLRLTDLS